MWDDASRISLHASKHKGIVDFSLYLCEMVWYNERQELKR